MRLVKRPVLLLALCGALGLAACGGDDGDDGTEDDGTEDDGTDDDGGDDGNTVNPDGADNTFVVDTLAVPSSGPEADEVALDLDGDSQPDNQLGGLLGTLSTYVDVSAEVNEQLAQGGIILLANLKATDLVDATGVGLYVYLGADPDPAPCLDETDTECGRHLDGSGSFSIDPESPEDAVIIGANDGGSFSGGPGEVTIEIALAGQSLALTLIGARAEMDVSADGLTGGKLGGAITVDDITNEIVPAITVVIQGLLAECTGGTAPDCGCEGGTETIRGLFDDAPADCMVTEEEVLDSPVTALLTTADVDLLDASGNPGTDGTNESVSLGVGFSAVPGTFTP